MTSSLDHKKSAASTGLWNAPSWNPDAILLNAQFTWPRAGASLGILSRAPSQQPASTANSMSGAVLDIG